MKKYIKTLILFAALLLSKADTLAQSRSLIAEILVESFHNGKDTVKLNPHLLISVSQNSCSEIKSLGIVGNTEFGMQVEVLQSKLGNEVHHVVGKAYFVKKAGKWHKIHEEDHRDITDLTTTALSARGFAELGIGGTGTDDPDFYIEYKERYIDN